MKEGLSFKCNVEELEACLIIKLHFVLFDGFFIEMSVFK
jgi:hypothetical protein